LVLAREAVVSADVVVRAVEDVVVVLIAALIPPNLNITIFLLRFLLKMPLTRWMKMKRRLKRLLLMP
jgi:hypothetical protein